MGAQNQTLKDDGMEKEEGNENDGRKGWKVTLLHSRDKLLNKFDEKLHDYSTSGRWHNRTTGTNLAY